MNGPLSQLARITPARTRRVSSYDRAGGNDDRIAIAAGETVTIAALTGTGIIRHIWFTICHEDPMFLRHLVMRIYWDGETEPSVEVPVGDFFGQGWGEIYEYVSLPMCTAPREGRALNCYFPMPYANGARIDIENESDQPCEAFYYYIDYEECDSVQEQGRFHAEWRRSLHQPAQGPENEWGMFGLKTPNLTDKYNHIIIDTQGHGHYVGVHYYVDSPTPLWYGEGDDMWFIDGESWPPSLHGTGTEDYFNTAWGPKSVYCHPYFGAPRVNDGTGWLGRTHVYRFHCEDPIRFTTSLRGSIEIGHANCLTSDTITVAFWYQNPCVRAHALPPAKDRANMPHVGEVEIHRWREAFRYVHEKAIWGNELLPPHVIKELAAHAKKTSLAPPAASKAAQKELQKHKKNLNRRTKK